MSEGRMGGDVLRRELHPEEIARIHAGEAGGR